MLAGDEGCPQSFVGERRRQPHVDDGHIGPVVADRVEEILAVADGGGDHQTVRLEHPGEAIPQEKEVFGYDNTHGISMVTTVGPPGGLLIASTPSKAASRRSMPCKPVPCLGSAPP